MNGPAIGVRPRRWLASLSAAVAILAISTTPAFAGRQPAATAGPAPVVGLGAPGALADRFIVVLRPGSSAADVHSIAGTSRGLGAQADFQYTTAIRGFAAKLSAEALAALRADSRVAWIEADRTVSLDADQANPPWGLDRVDQRNLPLNANYHYDVTGSGVTAYVIDTGIRTSHAQFGGRARSGYDAIDGGAADDCHGHGTHVAGTVGGSTYGVAKGVSLVAVRVLNCQGSGSNSQVIAGIDWVTADHDAGEPAVANMSLGGSASTALDNAVSASIADGVTYAVAAGNGNALGQPVNACNGSPSRVAAAITVSATDSSDRRASFANYGTCLDIFAPGVSITSAWHTSDTATNTISGTSMATPHVAGAAALYLQGNGSASPQAVRDHLVNTATTGVVINPGSGSPNRLLYTLGGSSPPPPPPPPPTGCTGYQQTFTGSLSGAGDADVHPNGTYYQSTTSGSHRGCLDGPNGVDFDLYLYRWNGLSWTRVASGTSSAPDETVTYSGAAGYYYWRVVSYSGSGSYTFAMTRP